MLRSHDHSHCATHCRPCTRTHISPSFSHPTSASQLRARCRAMMKITAAHTALASQLKCKHVTMRGRSGSRRQDISGAEHTGRLASVVCTHQLTHCSLDCRLWAFAPAGHVAPWRISLLSQPSARVYRWLAPRVSAATAPTAVSDDARACKHACYHAATAKRGRHGESHECMPDPSSSRSQRTDDIASLQTARCAEPGKVVLMFLPWQSLSTSR